MSASLRGVAGSRLPLRGQVRLGSGPEADILIAGAEVASLHARFFRREGRWHLEPLAPLLVDGMAAVGAIELPPDCELRVGTVSLRFRQRKWRLLPFVLAAAALAGLALLAAAVADEKIAPPEAAVLTEEQELPDCDPARCLERARERLAAADAVTKEVASASAFTELRLLREAHRLAFADGELQATLLERITARQAALEERCSSLRFTAARHLALGESEAAAEVAERMLAAFPEEGHACHAEAKWLLQRYGKGGR